MRLGVWMAFLALGIGFAGPGFAQPLPTSRSDLAYSFAPVVKKVSLAPVYAGLLHWP